MSTEQKDFYFFTQTLRDAEAHVELMKNFDRMEKDFSKRFKIARINFPHPADNNIIVKGYCTYTGLSIDLFNMVTKEWYSKKWRVDTPYTK